MLKQLDTLIGFAVVMSVVSMLIMAVTQAISSALALRGKNLVDALEPLFLKYAPELRNPQEYIGKRIEELKGLLAGGGTALTGELKTSLLSKVAELKGLLTHSTEDRHEAAGQGIQKLELLFGDNKNTLTDDDKTAAKETADQLKTLVVAPSAGNLATQLAAVILKRPALSDSLLSMKEGGGLWRLLFWRAKWWEDLKLSSTIRPEECWEAIGRIANSSEEDVRAFLSENAGTTAPEAIQAAKILFSKIKSPDAAQAKQALIAAMKSAMPGLDVQGLETHFNTLVANGAVTVQTEIEKWKANFQMVQDRAEQWFAMHTRRITVVLAFIAALVLQLDAFALFTRLANDADLRNQLVNLAPAMQKRVDEALNVKFAGTVYSAALKELKKENADAKNFGEPSVTDMQASADAHDWLKEQAKKQSLNEQKTSGLTEKYDELVQSKSKERTDAAQTEFKEVAALYEKSKLQLIPEPYPEHPSVSLKCGFPFVCFSDLRSAGAYLGLSGEGHGKHFFGMLAAAILLTLGAPFWFNLLKSLSSLRSSVAEQMDKEKKVAKT